MTWLSLVRCGSSFSRAASAFALLLTALACEKTPEPQAQSSAPAPAPAPSPAPAAASATPTTTGSSNASANAPAEIAYELPKTWQTVPSASTMRKATIKVPKQAGDPEDAELTYTIAGGSKDANVARWCNQLGQTEPSKTEQRTVNGMQVTIVEVKGSYAGMGGGPKKDGYMLLGALVPGAQQQLHFFKMVGPEKTVTAARKDFDAFVGSLRAK